MGNTGSVTKIPTAMKRTAICLAIALGLVVLSTALIVQPRIDRRSEI